MKKKLLSFFALAVIGVLAYAATQATQTSRRAEGTEVTFDYVAAGVAGETLTKVNLNFQVNMGEGKEDRTDRNFRGYKDYAGTNLPAECQVAIGEEQKVDENGLIVAQNRYLAVYGLHTGDKVSVYYTGVPEGKTPTYCPGTSVDTKAKIGSTELVPTESAIASGDVIEITKAGSKNYIVMSVFTGMRITKVVIKKAALYDITIADGIENGTVKTSVAKAAAGDEVTVTATPAEFYQLEAITVKDADNADVTVTDGKFTMPAKAVTVSATFTIDSSVETYDYVAAGVAGETLTKVNLNFQVNMGEGKEDRTDRNFRGYKDYAGTNLPAECQVAIGEEQKVDENGLIVAQNRYLAVYGLHTGDKVSVYYTGVPEGKTPTYCPGTSVDTKAKIGSTELVPTESAIASGDVIEITKAGSKNYIVMSVFTGMRITKVVIKKAALYDITIADGIENGTVKTSVAKAAAGDEVTVTATPAEFYQLEAITVKDADNADVTVTDGKFTMPAKAVTVSATFTIDSSVETYDYVAAGVAGETLTKVNLNFQVNMGEGKEDRTDRNFRGYKDYAGTNLPAECQVAIGEEQKVDENGLIVAQNRYLAVYGLHTGDKVSVYYTGVPEGKTPTYCPGTSVDTKAKIGSTELVPTESAIASGDVIEITKAGSKNYIVMSVFTGMRITKVVIKKAALYDITIADGIENGTVKTSVAKAAAGDEVTVTATPAEFYQLEAITVKDADDADVTVTDGKFTMPAKAVTVSATFTIDSSVETYDYVAAGVAGETLTKVNLNFQVNMGEGKEDRTDRNFRGYKDYAGTNLPAECQVAIGEEQKVDENGLIVAQNRYLAVYGLHTGDKVSVYYTGVPEGKTPTYCPGTSVDTKAKIGSTELVPTESAIASGDVIEITKAGSKNYIVMSVFAGMRITKVVIKKAALYDITIADGIENGTVKTSVAKAAAGDEVTVTATPAEGFALEAIAVKDADNADVTVTDGKFIMPAKAVTISATFVAIPKFYIIGNMNDWSLTSMTEMTFNAETQAYEYEYAPATAAAFAFSDVATSESWDDFNANHRYAIGEGDQNAKLNETVALQKVNGAILLAAGTYKISVAKDKSTVTITGEVTPPTPVTVDKLYIMGTGTPKGWGGTTELTFNETAQAFEYEATVTTEDTYLTFGDAEFTSWDDFNGKHRYAPGEGNTEAVVDAEVQLVLVNDGNVLLKTPGTYKISVTKDLKMTITTGGTGINGIYVDGAAGDIFSDGKPVYNLSGQRVFKGYKGIVIKNGRKVVIK